MSIRFVNRFEFKNFLLADEYKNSLMPCECHLPPESFLISVSDTIYEQNEIEQFIAFAGIPPDRYIALNFPDNSRGINTWDAKRLVEFIKRSGRGDFIVHCFMGISRSGAIAKFIDEFYEMNDPLLENYTIYNKQVYNSLNAVIGNDIASFYAELEKLDRPSFSE